MAQHGAEWFAAPDPATGERGLRFSCTMCGNCCSGPEGYVLVSDAETAALAGRLGISVEEFIVKFTRSTREGRSLVERETFAGLDCVFLDRVSQPGKAVCGVYDVRPAQCRTWPFWISLLSTRESWERAGRTCPGLGKGPLHGVQQIRIMRDTIRV